MACKDMHLRLRAGVYVLFGWRFLAAFRGEGEVDLHAACGLQR